MGKIKTFLKLLMSDRKRIPEVFVNNLIKAGLLNWMSDEAFLKLRYRTSMHEKLNLENPQTFNEKLQWLKLYDCRPEYTMMVDKYQVREYIARTIGEEYLIPLLGVWEDPEEIDFDSLPDQFVLKCNHDSGSVILCRDKSTFDVEGAKAKLQKHMKQNLFWWGREWPYKNVKRCVIAEKYMEDGNGNSGLRDYKFFCFNNEPRFLYISQGLENHETARISFFDFEGNSMPFSRSDYKSMGQTIDLPETMDQMKSMARLIAKDINCPFVRIDFYSMYGRVYFSEITFFPCSGYLPFEPVEWDYKLGEWIDLPKVN